MIMRIAHSHIRVISGIAFSLIVIGTASADWPNFRGSNFDGISEEKGLKTAWTDPLKMVWQREIGSAFSSFAAVKDRIYTCGMGDKQQILYCLNADNGDVIWSKPFEKEYRNEHGDGTRATPTVHDGRVYILGAHGRLLCVDAENGSDIWDHRFDKEPTWGYSGSVLIEGDLAIATPGGESGSIAAFDRKTGKLVWKSGPDLPGYAMPYPFTFEGRRYVVGFGGTSATIVEAATGKEAWRTAWKTSYDVNAAMPIFHDGHLLLTSGYQTGAGLFKLSAVGDRLKGEEVWKSDVLLAKFQSCVLHDGFLYASDQKAFKCAEFMTGKERWSEPRVANGTLVLAEGNLFLLTEGGELRIGKANPDGFSPTTTAKILDGRCWSVLVLHQGRIYARNLERVVCFQLK
jgi:outer membrane protein assembly factor BamB